MSGYFFDIIGTKCFLMIHMITSLARSMARQTINVIIMISSNDGGACDELTAELSSTA